jgi:hypothetical protein
MDNVTTSQSLILFSIIYGRLLDSYLLQYYNTANVAAGWHRSVCCMKWLFTMIVLKSSSSVEFCSIMRLFTD